MIPTSAAARQLVSLARAALVAGALLALAAAVATAQSA